MSTFIKNRIAIGAGWMISLRWVDRVIGLISIAILARLILPADFGLVAYAMVFLGILDQFLLFSFETVLIRDQQASKETYSTVWTLQFIKGLVLATILAATAQLAAAFFGEPKVEGILYWVALNPMIRGFTNIGIVDFQKHLNFHKEFYFNLGVRICGSIITVILAVILRSYWALVYGAISQTILRVMLSYVMSDFRPRFCLEGYSKVLSFSAWLLAQNIFFGINTKLPVIVIGRFLDAQAVAFFNMASELTSMMTGQLAAPIRRALYPGISKIQDDPSQMASIVTSALGIIVLVGVPATLGIGATAPLLIPAILGSNWTSVAPIVQVLALYTAIGMYFPNSNVIYYALGRPKITAHISALRVCLLAPAILVVVPAHGVMGAAWAMVAVGAIILMVDYLVILRMTSVKLARAFSVVWRSSLAAGAMVACVMFVLDNPMISVVRDTVTLHLVLCIAVGMFSYIMVLGVLWWMSGTPDGPETHVIRVLKGVFHRRNAGLTGQESN